MKAPARALHWLALLLPACRVGGHAIAAEPGETTILASSTMGYGCVVPPFATTETPADAGACGSAVESYILTASRTTDDPSAGPPGRYRLVGRWAAARSSWSAWMHARGEATSEGAPPASLEYRVLEVRDWCVEWGSVPAAYREVSALAPASAAWRTKLCG